MLQLLTYEYIDGFPCFLSKDLLVSNQYLCGDGAVKKQCLSTYLWCLRFQFPACWASMYGLRLLRSEKAAQCLIWKILLCRTIFCRLAAFYICCFAPRVTVGALKSSKPRPMKAKASSFRHGHVCTLLMCCR